MAHRRSRARCIGASVAVAALVLSVACTTDPGPRTAGSSASTSAETREAVDPSGGVTAASPMTTSRAAHAATVLGDGTVLITGGFGDRGGAEASAELFDPATGRFASTGSMSVGRQSHTATLLDDGRVLIVGGYDPVGTRLATAEIYDPATGRSSPTDPMAGPRADQTATLLSDGRVLIAGGTGPGYSFLSSAEIYDPSIGSFTPTGSMSVPRDAATSTLLKDGRVLVAGGHTGRDDAIEIYASAEIFDPESGRFTPVGRMALPRHKHDAVLLSDGRVLIVGGSDARDDLGLYDSAEIFDPTTGRFSEAGDLNDPRYKMRGTTLLLPDGRAVVCCGASNAEVFDPASGRFASIPGSLGVGPLFAAAARVGPDEILVTGGYSLAGPPTADAWLIHA